MATNANIPYGLTVLKVQDGASSTYVKLDEVTNVSGFNTGEIDEHDVSYLDQPSSDKEFIPGLRDPGDFTYEQNYTNIIYDRNTDLLGIVKNWKLTLPDDASTLVATFAGYIKKVEVPEQQPNSPAKCVTTVRRTGGITYASS